MAFCGFAAKAILRVGMLASMSLPISSGFPRGIPTYDLSTEEQQNLEKCFSVSHWIIFDANVFTLFHRGSIGV